MHVCNRERQALNDRHISICNALDLAPYSATNIYLRVARIVAVATT